MKTENKILALSIILGVLAWVADSALDYFFVGQRSFWELLLRDTSPHEIYVRLALSVSFFIFGIVTSRLFAAHRRTKEYLATTLHSIGDAVIAVDTAGIVTFLNPTAHQLTGWTPKEAAGELLGDVFHIVNEKTGERLQYPVHRVLQEGIVVGLPDPIVLIARDGTRRPIDDSAAPIKNEDGNVVGAVLIFRDIMEHRKAVEALREEKDTAQRYLNIAAVIIIALDAQGNVTLINRKGCQVLGYTEDEIIGQNWFNNFIPERMRREVTDAFSKLMAGEIEPVEYFENPVITKTGEERIIAWHNKVLADKEAAIIGTLSSGEDVTERQWATAALQESEENLRTIFTTAEDCIFIKDRELRFTRVNPSVERLLGLPASQLIGCTEEDVFGVEGGGHIRDVDARVLAGETIEEEVTRPVNGVLTTLHVIKMPMRDRSGTITGLYGIARNITHRKRSEDALRESEVRLQRQNAALAQVDMRKILVRGDLNTAVRRITEAAAETLEVERASVWLYNDDCSAIRCIDLYKRSKEYHSDGIELEKEKYPAYFAALEDERTIAAHDARVDPRTREFLDSYLAPLGITSMLDAPIRLGDQIAGVICHEHVGPARRWTLDEQNFATSMADSVALALEISERKRTEEELRESEKRFQGVALSSVDWIWEVDKNGTYTFASGKVKHILGYDPGEIIGKTPFDLMPREEAKRIREVFKRIASEKKPIVDLENWNLTKKGEKVCLLTNGVPILDEHGNLKGYRGVDKDITERKRAEEIIRESENLLRTIVNTTQEAMISIGQDGLITLFNPAAEKMFGRKKEEMMSQPLDCLMPEKYRQRHQEYMKSYFTTGKPDGAIGKMLELPGVRSDGSIFPMEISLSAGRRGKEQFVIAVARDITERKRTEAALRRQRDMIPNILDAMENGVYIISENYEIEYANPALISQFGPCEGQKCHEYFDNRKDICPWCKNEKIRAGKTLRWEWHCSKSGMTYDVLNTPIRNPDGSLSTLVVLHDITERKRSERAARQAERVLQQIFRESLDVIMIIDEDGEVLKVSEVARDVLGYATDDLVGKNCSILFPPQPEQSKEEFLARLRVYGGIFEEQRILRADGSVCVMDLTATVIPWEKGKAILATFRDVTERRHAGETLRRKREKIPLQT